MHYNPRVSECHLRRRRNEIIFFFSCLQLDALRSLKMNSTMNIVDNYRPVQNLGSRKVKSSFSSTQAPPTTTDVTVPTEAASIALKISNVLLMLVLFLGEVFFHWMICKTRFSAWGGGGRGGNNAGLSVQFWGRAGWSRKRLCYTRLYIQQHFCNSILARLYFSVLLPLSIQQLGAGYFVNSL